MASYTKDRDSAFEQAQESMNPQSSLPSDIFATLLQDQLGRDVLGRLGAPQKWEVPVCTTSRPYQWLDMERLPIPPAKAENYDLLERWQSVLSAAHTMECCTALALIRRKGHTSVYLGACKEGGWGVEPARRLSRAARIHMPGMGLSPVEQRAGTKGPVQAALENLQYTGLITGLPSSRQQQTGQINLIQTLDKLAYGVKDDRGLEQDYALLILAEPARDQEIVSLTHTLLQLRGAIHRCVSMNLSASWAEGSGKNVFASAQLGHLLSSLFAVAGAFAGPAGMAVGMTVGKAVNEGIKVLAGVSAGVSRGENYSASTSGSHEEKDFIAAYCEELVEKHIHRLQNGRNLGFWNTGIYVAGASEDTVEAVLGMLRSIYSGHDTYVEPIRAFNTGIHPGIRSYIRNYTLLPLPVALETKLALNQEFGLSPNCWHIFGPLYQNFSTPMTTEELSIAASLPRRDVPGLRFVHNAVKLTANPPMLPEDCRSILLGRVMDMGMITGQEYRLNIDSLVRHVLNDGITGYGKSITTLSILSGIAGYGVPWLVIEPVKTDYVEWAMEYNKTCPEEDRIAIYMPGYEQFYGQRLETMHLNPFQPCAPAGVPLNIQGHLDALASLLTASVSMGEVLPLLMKEALQDLADNALGPDPSTGRPIANSNQADPKLIQCYPGFSQLLDVVQALMKSRGYAAENHQNITAAMETRIKSLLLGWKQDFFDAPHSTPGKELFGRKVIINLIGIESDEDKAFFMSLILRALSEYRSASYYYLPQYRQALQSGDRLMHLTVVEEAHRLISLPTVHMDGANPQGATASMFSNMLREIRKWGEGLMIVDQQPSQLIPDAIKNTDLKIIHRMPALDDRQAVGNCMGLNQEQMDLIAALDRGEVIISSSHDDAALWVKVDRK